ncbi:MAG: hypothetical protein A2Z18_07530 [Armatimonadetes bacterium RBG_16_58_9]|nr:MAG: hypothetical protein A2Z18_07530 [Armatimonadetes bacterium RBG_16_58_9]
MIADALLPDVSAVEFYKSLNRRDIPVIYVGVLYAQWDELHRLGPNVLCLSKPFDPDEAAALAGLMLRRLEEDVRSSNHS